MKIFEVENKSPILINKLLEIWEDSVRASHLFLSNEEIKNIKKQISQNIQKKLSAFSGISSIIVRRKTRMEDLRWT